ncbi:MAG: transcriptional regulator [Cyanobacteria bacterium J06634_5]
MDQQSKTKLEAKGWQVGTAADFLNLTAEDLLIIEIKLALSRRLEERQQKTASMPVPGESTPEEANTQLTADAPLTSIDQLIREMIATGASPQEIGQLIAGIERAVA